MKTAYEIREITTIAQDTIEAERRKRVADYAEAQIMPCIEDAANEGKMCALAKTPSNINCSYLRQHLENCGYTVKLMLPYIKISW